MFCLLLARWNLGGLSMAMLVAVIWGHHLAARALDPSENFRNEKGEFFQRPGVHVSEIVRARGYYAEEHEIVAADGYVLGMTRCMNPLVGEKRTRALAREPILMIHGTLTDGNSFVTNSFEIEKPKDWSHVDADKLSEEQLSERYGRDPAAKSLAFLAMNFGHEVWFLHRRGAQMSQKRLDVSTNNLPTVMQKYLVSVEHSKRLLNGGSPSNNIELIESRAPPERRSGRSPLVEMGHVGLDKERAVPLDRNRPAKQNQNQNQNQIKSKNHKDQNARATEKKKKKTTKSGSNKLVESLKALPGAFLHGHLLRDIQVSFDQRLWNHSLDEQAAYDLPSAIEFTLKTTRFDRLAVVGDSSGGALIMMSLILNPRLGDKLSKAVAWVPSFHIGHAPIKGQFAIAEPIFQFVGPYPFAFASLPLQAFIELACSLELMQKTLCALAVDASWGPSYGKQAFRTEFAAGYLAPVSAHEYLQLIQTHTRQASHMFDFANTKKNLLAYGQEKPPRYNASLINFEYLSIYVGTTDSLVTEDDIATVHKELRVPHRIVTMRAKGTNHGAVLFHDEAATMVMIPTYKDITSNGYHSRHKKHQGHSEEENAFNEI